MDTLKAFEKLQDARRRGATGRVFDWDKAALILRERKPLEASAGLHGDMEWTGGYIWKDGKPFLDDYTYLLSLWAIPILVIGDEEIECWKNTDGCLWSSGTKWPESAMKIIAS